MVFQSDELPRDFVVVFAPKSDTLNVDKLKQVLKDMGGSEAGQKIRDSMVRGVPLGRIGQPDDYPGLVAFLASDDAAFMTGQTISVSGGLSMHG